MFKPREYYTRMTFAILGTIAISMVFTRCSPLASSTSKFRNRLEAAAPLGAPLSSHKEVEARSELTLAESNTTPGLVMTLEDYEDETSLLPRENRLTFSDRANGDELESFKEERTLLIEGSDVGEFECNAYFGLSMTEEMIDSFELNPVQTECEVISEDLIRFSISPSVSEEKWEKIAEYLDSMTIYITGDAQLSQALAPVSGIPPVSRGPR